MQKKCHKKLQVETQTCTKTYRHQGFQTDLAYGSNKQGDELNESWWMEGCDDDEWQPSDESMTSIAEEPCNTAYAPHKEKKYLIFESQLELLTNFCRTCGKKQVNKKVFHGSAVTFSYDCACGERFRWSTQPFSGTMPCGNLLLAGSILFTGGNPHQVLNMMQHLNVASISKRTFFRLQTMYLVPVFENCTLQNSISFFQLFVRTREVCE